MYGITNGPHFNDNGLVPSQGKGFLSDNYGGYLTPKQTQFAKNLGRGFIAIEILDWADQVAVPNQYSFVKDLVGARFSKDPKVAESYKDHYNKIFNTLGNGKLELNDVLAFPLNLYFRNSANKAAGNNPNYNKKKNNDNSGNSGNGNNNNVGGGKSNVELG